MTITVTGPDGSTIDFPDGTDNGTIHTVMSKHFGEQKAAPQEQPHSLFQTIDDSVRMVAQGATFGFADEVAGQMNSLFGVGDRSSNIDAERSKDDAIQKRMPVTSAALKILGGVMSPVTKLAGLAGAAINAPRYVNYALQGASLGGLAGAGESTEGNRGAGAMLGGGTGALFGTAFPAAAEGVGMLVAKAADKIQGPVSGAARRMLRALGRDNMTPDDAAARLQELGPDATLADIGPNMRGLAEASATQPGKSLTAAENLVSSRASGRSERLVQAALDAAGVAHVDEAIAKRATMAKPLYEAAFAPQEGTVTTGSKQITSPILDRLLDQPELKAGIRQGMESLRRQYAVTGEEIAPADYALVRNAQGQFERQGKPTLRLLDAAKRGLDLMLQSGGKDIRNDKTGLLTQKGHEIDAMRRTLVNQLDDLSPKDPVSGESTYKMAREAWGGPSQTIEALSQVQKVADTARDGSDITGRLFGSKAARDKLKGLFADDETMAEFAKKVSNERTMADTERKLTGNSRTQYRNAAQADLADGGLADAAFSLAERPTIGNAIYQGAAAAKNWLRAPPTKIADEMTGLYSTDPAERNIALEMLRRKTGAGALLYGQFDKVPNLLSNVGGYSGGLVGGQR